MLDSVSGLPPELTAQDAALKMALRLEEFVADAAPEVWEAHLLYVQMDAIAGLVAVLALATSLGVGAWASYRAWKASENSNDAIFAAALAFLALAVFLCALASPSLPTVIEPRPAAMARIAKTLK